MSVDQSVNLPFLMCLTQHWCKMLGWVPVVFVIQWKWGGQLHRCCRSASGWSELVCFLWAKAASAAAPFGRRGWSGGEEWVGPKGRESVVHQDLIQPVFVFQGVAEEVSKVGERIREGGGAVGLFSGVPHNHGCRQGCPLGVFWTAHILLRIEGWLAWLRWHLGTRRGRCDLLL